MSNNSYIYWENTNTKAALNLAIEESLLDSNFTKENKVFMLWQNEPSVIIGRHQNAFEEVDMPYLEEHNIALVRRHSGGGAVFHDLGNMNFTFIIPADSPKIEFSIVLNPIIEALAKIGITASLSGRNDILVDNRKISGAAQTKGKHAILVHGTLLIDVDMDRLEHVLAGNPDKYTSKGISSIRSRVANLKDFLNQDYSQAEAVHAIKQELIAYFLPNMTVADKLPQETIEEILENAHNIAQKRYANPEWTLMKSPPFTVSERKKFPFGSMRVSYNIVEAKIKECKIEGDFFAIGDISLIEKKLQNVNYNALEIEKSIQEIDFSKFILNAPSLDGLEFTEIKSLFAMG